MNLRKKKFQWSQPDLSKNKTKIKHHFVKITSLFSKNKTHFSRTNTHIFLLFLHKIPFTYYKARHAHKRLYTVLPKYSKIQVLPGITSCRLVKDNKQAIELNSLLINNMPEGGYG